MPTLSRRHPAAIALLLMLGLFVTGTAYAAVAPQQTEATVTSSDSVANGKKLFVANCATCHGANGLGIKDAGPSLAGVGAASVDFQMGTGRMPMAEPGVQAPGNIKVKFTDEQIIGLLKEAEAGAKTGDLARRHGVSEATIYNWKARYGGLEVSEAKRLRSLEDENAKLKRLLADAMLDNAGLKDLLAKKW